jgi:hypothetical protein
MCDRAQTASSYVQETLVVGITAQLLDDLKGEFHLLPADQEAQIHLPETTEPDESVYQEFYPQPFPKPRQFDMQGDLAQLQARVPIPFAMVATEKVERKRIQMPAVSGVAP